MVSNSSLPRGSERRKAIPLYSGVMRFFPAALAMVAQASVRGNRKHCPGQPMVFDSSVSMDHGDCILRHMINMDEGDGCDENGVPHVAYVAWRALALAQQWAEKHGAPAAPGASHTSKGEQ